MRRSTGIRATGAALVVSMLTLLSGVALAYFSTSGVGSASAGVTALTAPAISAATPGPSTVTLTWGAVTAPGSGTVTYSVSRDGGAAAGTCPTAASPTSVTTCIDNGVAIGTHSYTVTARWRSWSATSGTTSAKVTTAVATHFTIAAATTTPVGAADNLTITALDAGNNTVASYTGSHNLTFSGASKSPGGTAPTVANSAGTATAFGTATAIAFTNGVAAITSSTKNGVMKLYKAETAGIAVSDGSISSEPTLAVTAVPGEATKLSLAAAATTAGVADNLTTTALDTYGNVATGYTGSHSITFSGPVNSPAGTVPTIANSAGTATGFGTAAALAFSAGVATPSGAANGAMLLYKSGTTAITASDGMLTATALSVAVAAAPASAFSLKASSAAPAAAASDNLTTTALDPYGNVATGYTGSHALTFSGASSSPSGTAPTVADSAGAATPFGTATAIAFTNGVATVTSTKNGVMKLYKAETAGIAVSDGSIFSEAPVAAPVAALAASKFALTNVTISAGSLGTICLFTCTVTGLGNSGTIAANVSVTDTYGNTISALGSGHSVSVTTVGGTISAGSLTIASTGAAESTTRFTFTAQASGTYTDKITAAKSLGTAYTSATAEASR